MVKPKTFVRKIKDRQYVYVNGVLDHIITATGKIKKQIDYKEILKNKK